MPTGSGEGEAGDASQGSSGGGLGHLPWQQIPKFVPGVRNVDKYVGRLKFLKELWPPEHIHLLGPRAALQVEGSAFQKISRISPEKLRQVDGVKILVESLGGSWGRTQQEEKYHFFEQAIFQVAQRSDETNDSYVARHDAFFEELIARNVTLEEVRAYILLRHSQLAAEDKKKVVVDARGNLTYGDTVKAIRLLGSKFFGDLQNRHAAGSAKTSERTKVYDIHFTEDSAAEETFYSSVPAEEEFDDEELLCYFLEQNVEDAVYIAEFEDSRVDPIQESNLAPVYVSYQEARQKLRDKAKARGFWPSSSASSSKGKHKGKGPGKKGKGYPSASAWGGGRGRTLADRIASSSCRLCGARGHWKRECPRRTSLPNTREDNRTEVTNYTTDLEKHDLPFPEVLQTLPPEAVYYMEEDTDADMHTSEEDMPEPHTEVGSSQPGDLIQCSHAVCLIAFTPRLDMGLSFRENLASKLLMCARKHRRCPALTSGTEPERLILSRTPGKPATAQNGIASPKLADVAFIATTGTEGALDTGASRTVVGSQRVPEILKGLDASCRAKVRKANSDVTFKFGNDGTLKAKHALLLPYAGTTWIRVELIPGNTPF